MRFSITTVVSTLLAMASAYTKPDYSQDPSGNAILTPGLNQVVPAGKPFTISWNPTTTGDISLVLLRGPSTNVVPIDTLADSIPNSGKFVWTPSTELKPDTTHYGLLLVVEGTGQYQYSTQFGLSNPDYEGSQGTSTTAVTVSSSTTTTTTTTTTSSSSSSASTVATTESTTTESTTTTAQSETATATTTVVKQTSTEPSTTQPTEGAQTTTTAAAATAVAVTTVKQPVISTARTTLQSSTIPSSTPASTPIQASVKGSASRNAAISSFGAVALG
ncbi:hypothetical protein AOCH_007280, partial [Aspergillus ochraceoroseus]